MRKLIALLLVCAASAALWASLDRPIVAPSFTGVLKGVAYTPSHLYTEVQKDENITGELIASDLEQISKIASRVRTYSTRNNQDRIVYLAKEYGLKVSMGIWLGSNRDLNEIEIAKGLQAIKDNPGVVDRVFVGNESIGVRFELKPEEVAAYIVRIRHAINNKKIELGTTEVIGTWSNDPVGMKKVADVSDYLGVHFLPYWEGISIDKGMDYVTSSYDYMLKQYPGKKIVIGETGWPSEGRVKKGSVPSAAMEATYLRQFLTLATAKNFDYYIMEAFDQPWKADQEGAVGAFWGILDAEGKPKFSFTGPLSSFSEWTTYAAIAAGASAILGVLAFVAVPAMGLQGYLLLGGIVGLIVTGGLFILNATSLRYVEWSALGGALFVIPAALFTAVLLLTETSEWALSLWRRRRGGMPTAELRVQPKVSIHLPTHNEPPLMVMQTLNALARLDYQNFEVIVLDNNTKDEALWKPVEAHCATLGPNFRFYHFDNMKGFKAGALNKALELTHPDATYIGVIDSDYQVAPHWLKMVMPGFTDEKVAVVQAPQDYRDAHESMFKTICYEEYATFFQVGMVERNEHNAIIQHGTMCVVARAALERVGRWSEWCITEDTELGLRLFEAGYTAQYTPVSMGKGLMPDTYDAYKGQRYRWVYGAMQIMKRHAKEIFLGKSKLTLAQRYHFVAGWLPWMADAFSLIFGVLAIAWTVAMYVTQTYFPALHFFDVPLTALSGVALTLFGVKTLKTLWLHRAKVETGFGGAAAAALTGLSLSYTVGMAVLKGVLTSSMPFLRTPKCEDTAPWTHALKIARAETVMLIGVLIAVGLTLMGKLEDPAEFAWLAALSVMAVPYAAALLVALGSTIKLGSRTAPAPEIAPAFPTGPGPAPNLDLAA